MKILVVVVAIFVSECTSLRCWKAKGNDFYDMWLEERECNPQLQQDFCYVAKRLFFFSSLQSLCVNSQIIFAHNFQTRMEVV